MNIKEFFECFAPSGGEHGFSDLIASGLSGVCDSVKTDVLGDVIYRRGGAGEKLLIAARLDAPGVVVTFIEDGFARFSAIGKLDAKELCGAKVIFDNGTVGIIGKSEKEEKAEIKNMFIDLCGGEVKIGDMAMLCAESYETEDSYVAVNAGARAACYALFEAINRVNTPKFDVYAVFAAQTRLGYRGTKISAQAVCPDITVSIGASEANDAPDGKKTVKMGEGSVLVVKDGAYVSHQDAIAIVENAASVTREAASYAIGDAGSIMFADCGAPSTALNIPVRKYGRYEAVKKSDVETLINDIVKILGE